MDYAYFYYNVITPVGLEPAEIFVGGHDLTNTRLFSAGVSTPLIKYCNGDITIGTTGTYEIIYSIAGTDIGGPVTVELHQGTSPIAGSQIVFTGGALLTQTTSVIAPLTQGDVLSLACIGTPFQGVALLAGSVVGITIQQIA